MGFFFLLFVGFSDPLRKRFLFYYDVIFNINDLLPDELFNDDSVNRHVIRVLTPY